MDVNSGLNADGSVINCGCHALALERCADAGATAHRPHRARAYRVRDGRPHRDPPYDYDHARGGERQLPPIVRVLVSRRLGAAERLYQILHRLATEAVDPIEYRLRYLKDQRSRSR